MPKRMLDDSLLTSHSLALLSPRAQDAFPRFILLADDFGCFEVVPRVLQARGWPYRSDVTEIEIAAWLAEYEAIGMLYVWVEEESGRTFGYLTGWHKEHGQRHRAEYSDTNSKGSKRRTPRPPGFNPASSQFLAARERTTILADLKIPSPFVPARELTGKCAGNPLFPDPYTQSYTQSQPQISAADGDASPAEETGENLSLLPAEDPAPKKKTTDPRHRPLTTALVAAYESVRGAKYAHGGAKDAAAVKRLASWTTDDFEIVRRFKAALVDPDQFWRAQSIAHFARAECWNRFAEAPTRRAMGAIGTPEDFEGQF